MVFETAATYSATLKVWNLNGFSELTEFEMIQSGGYAPYFNETFESGLDLRFWEVENPDDEISWEILPVAGSGHGQSAVGINLYEYFSFISVRD